MLECHPVSEIFPLMEGAEYDALKADIAANGLRESIWLHPDGRIIDGRNRYRACYELGLVPKYKTWDGNGSLLAFVLSLNLHRRHLSSSQRAMIALDVLPIMEEEARARMVAGAIATNTGSQRIDYPEDMQGKAAKQAATMMGTNRQYVADAKKIKEEAPDLVEVVKNGGLSLPQAKQELSRRKQIDQIAQTANAEAGSPQGRYDVIVIDPPWPMKKIKREARPNQIMLDYPTMTEDELAALDIPCADNCHVWLWTTQKFLPLAFDLLDAWGLKYVCEFVWHKPGGFQPYGLPQYNCEMALYARRGSPQFIDTKAFSTCFDAPRGKHSEKPEDFYDTVRRVTAGRRLDMFGRGIIDGFVSWGKEAPDTSLCKDGR